MRVVGLISGGKDSIYALMECVKFGHQVVALANLQPADAGVDELDSFTFQTVGHNVVDAQAAALRLPLFRVPLRGGAQNQELQYHETAADEVEDLFALLRAVKERMPDVEAVSCGAILSTYQRTRVENVCARLGLVLLAFLWQRDQAALLREMIGAGVDAVLIKVAAAGLYPRRHMLRSLRELEPELTALAASDGLNVCGEGGEYETLVLDCPMFHARIVLDETILVGDALDNQFTPSGHAHIAAFHLEPKTHVAAPLATALPQDAAYAPSILIDAQQPAGVNVGASVSAASLSSSSPPPATATALALPCAAPSFSGVHCTKEIVCLTARQSIGASGSASSPSVEAALGRILAWAVAELAARSLLGADVFFAHMLLPSIGDYAAANRVYASFFAARPPSRCSFAVAPMTASSLSARAHVHVELLASSVCRDVLHVQSHSRWAPANIGPYAQASNLGGVLFLAGQIGLEPARMRLATAAAKTKDASASVSESLSSLSLSPSEIAAAQLDCLRAEGKQCVANCAAVLQAVGGDLGRTLAAVQYVPAAASNHVDSAAQASSAAAFESAFASTDAANRALLAAAHDQLARALTAPAKTRAAEHARLAPLSRDSVDSDSDGDSSTSASASAAAVAPHRSAMVRRVVPRAPCVPVLSVCVPGLPRDAAVEVHLTAWQRRIDRAFAIVECAVSESSALQDGNMLIGDDSAQPMKCRHHASIVWQSACSAILTLSAAAAATAADAAATSSSMQHGFDQLVDALDEHRRAADLEWASLVHARVFYIPTAAAFQRESEAGTACDSDATVHMHAAFASAYRRVRAKSGDLQGDEAAIAASAPALTFVPVLAIGARLGSSPLPPTAAVDTAETASPCIAMHVLMLDLARIEAQSWIAGVRPSERVG